MGTHHKNFLPPPYWKRVSAIWIDFLLLLGVYLILGFLSDYLYQESAYPPAKGMQLYSARDFVVYWFFVRWVLIITAAYLLLSYKFMGATLGQKMVGIRLLTKQGLPLSNKNIVVRTCLVIALLVFIMLPGPVIAILFFAIGAKLLNTALSVLILLIIVFSLLYFSIMSYQKGNTQSYKDKLSQTRMVDIP